MGYLNIALEIIHESFPSIRQWSLDLEQDPETDEKYILIDIVVEGAEGEILDAYDKYVDSWVVKSPDYIREIIKLSFRVI